MSSCNEPKVQGLTYRLYHRTDASLFGDNYRLIIEVDATRGLMFGIPWGSNKLSSRWDEHTGQLEISLPGTVMLIDRSEYFDIK